MGEPRINDASRRPFTVYLNMIFGSMMLLTAERRPTHPQPRWRKHVSVIGRRETVLFSGISRCEERSDTLLSGSADLTRRCCLLSADELVPY